MELEHFQVYQWNLAFLITTFGHYPIIVQFFRMVYSYDLELSNDTKWVKYSIMMRVCTLHHASKATYICNIQRKFWKSSWEVGINSYFRTHTWNIKKKLKKKIHWRKSMSDKRKYEIWIQKRRRMSWKTKQMETGKRTTRSFESYSFQTTNHHV